MMTLIVQTFYELKAKATLIVLAGISTLTILFFLVAFSASKAGDSVTMCLFGQPLSPPLPAIQLGEVVRQLQSGMAGGMFAGLVLFGVFATAGLIPDTLEKGTIDLYLSKPIARWELFLGKYLGGVAVILVNVVYFVGALWLVFGLKVGVWNISFLASSFALTFAFACLFSIVASVGIVSRNMAISIIVAYLHLFLIANLLQHRDATLYRISANAVYRGFIDVLYYILPQLSGMQNSIEKFITSQSMDWRPFVQSFLSSGVIFLGGAAVFRKKDF